MTRDRVCVIGAGVSGLSTGICLADRGYSVTILADRRGEQTTSSVAAAFWYPFWTGDAVDHSWYKQEWAADSYFVLRRFLDVEAAGVTEANLFEYFDAPDDAAVARIRDGMWWNVIPQLSFRDLEPEEWQRVVYPGPPQPIRFAGGITFKTLVVNMRAYLPFLDSMFTERGGRFEEADVRMMVTSDNQRTLTSVVNDYDFVVNCSGTGARYVVNDSLAMPREGIVLGLEPVDGLSDILLLHTGDHFGKYPLYIVPRGGPNPDLILGGTITPMRGQVRHYESVALNEIPHARTKDHAIRIIESCQLIEPKLRGKAVNRVSVGYRPARVKGSRTEPVRLEPEFSGPLAGKLVHNYGHGGGGVTFSWGCAERAATWVEQLNSSREVTGSSLARVSSDRKPELA